jgi:16S rRNA (cytidine1402-2'-O)-methyltransferase
MNAGQGKLVVVPTPVGNLQDMTFRAVTCLKGVDLILAEDTRTSGKLLKHYDIQTPTKSFHAFNEHKQLEYVLDQLKNGTEMALISDAGTPGISDPGFILTRACIEQGVPVECLPGATAFVPALVNSGLPTDKFVFEGFLPPKKGRQQRLNQLLNEPRTMVFYESPYRLIKTLEQFITVFGSERRVSISREISKMYEENIHGTLEEVFSRLKSQKIKGELVIVLEGLKLKK